MIRSLFGVSLKTPRASNDGNDIRGELKLLRQKKHCVKISSVVKCHVINTLSQHVGGASSKLNSQEQYKKNCKFILNGHKSRERE